MFVIMPTPPDYPQRPQRVQECRRNVAEKHRVALYYFPRQATKLFLEGRAEMAGRAVAGGGHSLLHCGTVVQQPQRRVQAVAAQAGGDGFPRLRLVVALQIAFVQADATGQSRNGQRLPVFGADDVGGLVNAGAVAAGVPAAKVKSQQPRGQFQRRRFQG